jgi:hypothetical protein
VLTKTNSSEVWGINMTPYLELRKYCTKNFEEIDMFYALYYGFQECVLFRHKLASSDIRLYLISEEANLCRNMV